MPWAGGVVVAVAQLSVLVVGHGPWRTEGAVGLAVVTLAGIGFAVFGGEDRPER